MTAAKTIGNGHGPQRNGDTVQRLLGVVRGRLGMEVAYLTEFDDDEQVVRMAAADPAGAPMIGTGTRVALARSYCRRVVDGDLPSVIPDTSAHPVTRALAVTREAQLGAYVGVPVRFADGRLFGTLCAASRSTIEFDDRDLEFVEVLAWLVADAIEREELHHERARLEAELTSVRALLAALDARDRYTGEHSQAVVELSCAVAHAMGLGREQRSAVEQVALLHDIGKLGIPDTILQKPGGLTEPEWDVMREHPAIGARIAAAIDAIRHLTPAIRAEHERWDGGGYPDGLAGEDVPLPSRIVLACDAYHAMTSDRPYRRAMTAGEACQELARGAGTQFDPGVVEALLGVVGGEDGC